MVFTRSATTVASLFIVRISVNVPREVGVNVIVSVSEEPTAITRFAVFGDVEYIVPVVSGLEEIVNAASGPTELTVIVLLFVPVTRKLPKSMEVVDSVIPFTLGPAAVAVKLPVIPIAAWILHW